MNYWRKELTRKLNDMFSRGYGRSRSADKVACKTSGKIYSSTTKQTYKQQLMYFADWMEERHPEERRWKKARQYSRLYLLEIESGISMKGKRYAASSVTTAAAAINKIFDIKPGDKDRFDNPVRHREDFTRSRLPVKTDCLFNEERNQDIVEFCKGVGVRINVLKKLQGRDLYSQEKVLSELERLSSMGDELTKGEIALLRALKEAREYFPEEDYLVLSWRDKGGRSRLSPIRSEGHRQEIIQRFQDIGEEELVWKRVPSHMDVHSYRAVYANNLYREKAREISTIESPKELYRCRKDRAGEVYDRVAMGCVAIALGHGSGRSVFADYYSRKEGENE